MENNTTQNQSLEQIKQFDQNDNEFWSARELQKALGYNKWESFISVVKKAIKSYESSPTTEGTTLNNHFRQVRKMVIIGSGVQKAIDDYELSRYACYLIAQNGDAKQ